VKSGLLPVIVAAIATAPPLGAQSAEACCTREALAGGLAIAERYRVEALADRRFTHGQFWKAVTPSLGSGALGVAEIGASLQGRPLRAVAFGRGPVRVLLWSQMHGDESTATMALADIFRFLSEATGDPLRERLRRDLSLTFVPLLNPDGAERFQRRNAAGIDVNRDARRLATPEARALSALRDRIAPDFGFNLHDQNARTRAGAAGPQAAIALLAPAYDSALSYNEVRARARLVAAGIATLLGHEIAGRVARYDDEYSPRAFGDGFQRRGTSTVLIETGALPGDPGKQRLRALNVAAILGALDAIATGRYRQLDPGAYERLPENTAGAHDALVLGGRLVLPGLAPLRADVAINYDDAVARTGGRISEIGDLEGSAALDTLDVAGLFLFPADSVLTTGAGATWLRIGAPAVFQVRRGPGPDSELVRRIGS
jgi:hypothetical protein